MKNIIGKQGEIVAVNFLLENKYKILETNYKNKIGEIDIIAKKNNFIVFVEVKFRSSLAFGYPREAVNLHKQNKIKLVAQCYLQKHSLLNSAVRFDVIEILNNKITHIENAF